VGNAAYLGALIRLASGPFQLAEAVPLDDVRSAAAGSPAGLVPLLRPIDAGLEGFPIVALTTAEVSAVARGQFVRPAGGLAAQADHYRLQGPDGSLVGIASASAGRLAPDKVFVAPPSAAPAA
jgi:tRNA pseudouridine55 synthase